VEHRIVQRVAHDRLGTGAVVRDGEPHPLRRGQLAGERRLERRRGLLGGEHRQEAELAEVDPEHRSADIRDQPGSAQDRAISP